MCGVCALCPAKFTGVTGVFFANSTVLLYRNYTGNNCQIPPFCSSRTTQVTQCGCEAGWTGQSCDVAANKFTVTLPAQAPQDFSGPYRASSAYGTDNMLFTKVTAGHANNTYTVRKADDGWEMVFAVRHCMPLPEMQCEGNDLHPPAGKCQGVLDTTCLAARNAGKTMCQLCTAGHAAELKTADCTPAIEAAFCNATSPPPPGPPSPGGQQPLLTTPTAELCGDKCMEEPMCKAWTWNGTVPDDVALTCVLKSDCPDAARSHSDWATSGQCGSLVEEIVYYNPVSSALPPRSGWVHPMLPVDENTQQVPTISYELMY